MKLKLKLIWQSTVTKIVLICTIIFLFILAVILPSVLTARPKGTILAFNRDAVSGTREAFVEKTLKEDKKSWTPGSNVREVRNNDSMITFVEREKNSVGYVSFGTVAKFNEDGDAVLRTDRNGIDDIQFASFDGVRPTKDFILSEEYSSSRNFNMFFRVNEDSTEYKITEYNWEENSIDTNILNEINKLKYANDFKSSYLFLNWIIRSTEAQEIINKKGEIAFSNFDDSRSEWFNEDWEESEINKYVNEMEVNKNKQILIEIVGSTSASAVMADLTKEFDETVSEKYGLKEEDLKFVIATNGSSDAVSKRVPGTDHPYIGIQSKNQDEQGFEDWGNYLVDGKYNELVYSSFAKDAILIIFNNKDLNVKESDLNINHEEIKDLYTYNSYMKYEDLFSNYSEVIK